MKTQMIYRHDLALLPDSSRVVIRPFIPSSSERVAAVLSRAMNLTEAEVAAEWKAIRAEFESRHYDIEELVLEQFTKVASKIRTLSPLSRKRELLIGALYSGEYALESAALFNPSIVPHPDQKGIAEGGLRFILSLRATGEGHISSIEFRSGEISPEGTIRLDPVSRYVAMPHIVPNPSYRKRNFMHKFGEMGFDNQITKNVMNGLEPEFTLNELNQRVGTVRAEHHAGGHELDSTLDCIRWLAESNYELRFSSKLDISERIIFPVSANESHGIEDARFVRFIEDDGMVMYYATYTAYNGKAILPQLIETRDFLHFRILTLNGDAVQNKGMALFPRRVGGRYVMLSRQDDENLFIMFSDNPHFWSNPQLLMRPEETWESVKIGNCGSPIETHAGWLVITHGVGPMRKYCIGAALLDLEDPTKVIGRLREPLISSQGAEREGYVPNVVYSCGSYLHAGNVILPFALSDKATVIASVKLDELLARMKS